MERTAFRCGFDFNLSFYAIAYGSVSQKGALPVLGAEVGGESETSPSFPFHDEKEVGLAALSTTLRSTEDSPVGWGE